MASDYYANDKGDYSISLQRTNNRGKEKKQLAFGDTVADKISLGGQLKAYTFDANAGDGIAVRMGSTSEVDPIISIFSPDGTNIKNAFTSYDDSYSSAQLNATLDKKGTYTILASDYYANDTGDYSISLQRTNNPGKAKPLASGDTVEDKMSLGGQLNSYIFQANGKNSRVIVNMGSTSKVDPIIQLFGPDGTNIENAFQSYNDNYSSAKLEVPLDQKGIYTILASDYYANDTGDYSLSIQGIGISKPKESKPEPEAELPKTPIGSNKKDNLTGTNKKDTINGKGGNDKIQAGDGNDKVDGGQGNDTLIGGPGNDFLHGGKGNDLLNGNAGNDVLVGNFGKDTLTGGPGDDLFFLEQKTSVAKKSAAQIITDFNKSSDFIGLDSGLTEEDITLKKSGNSTIIEVKKTGKILAVVEKTKPQDLKWCFVSVDGEPEAIQNLETFATPKVKQKSGNTYEMTMNGSEGSKYLSTIKKTENEVYVQRIKFTPQGGVQTTITFNKDGTRAEAKTNDSSRKWIFENEDNSSVAVSVIEPGSKKPIEIAKVTVKSDYDELCAAGKEFCKNVGTIKQIFDIIPVAATGGVGATVQGALEIADIGCMVMFGDDQDLAEKAAEKVLNKASDGIFKGLEGGYTKWSNKKIDESMNSDFGKKISKKVNDKAAEEFFGKANKSVQDHTTDAMSGVLNWVADKSGIPRGQVLANFRKELGIDWCDKEKEATTGEKEPTTEEKEPTTEEKEVRVYFQPHGNPWAISKLYLVSPEEKFIGTAPNSVSGLGNSADAQWRSLGTFPVGTELEFETRVQMFSDLKKSKFIENLTLSSKSSDTASIEGGASELTWLGFEDGYNGSFVGVQIETPDDFNDTLVNIDNVRAVGNSIFVA